MNKVYKLDTKKKKYIIKNAYKNLPSWKAGKGKRKFAWFMIFLPFILFGLLLGVFTFLQSFNQAISISASISLIIAIISWSIGIIILKFQNHSKYTIPVNRKNDELHFFEDHLEYSYISSGENSKYEKFITTIKYKDIEKIEYSVARYKLFLLCNYETKSIYKRNGKEIINKIARFDHNSKLLYDIPMYFEEDENVLKDIIIATEKIIKYVDKV